MNAKYVIVNKTAVRYTDVRFVIVSAKGRLDGDIII